MHFGTGSAMCTNFGTESAIPRHTLELDLLYVQTLELVLLYTLELALQYTLELALLYTLEQVTVFAIHLGTCLVIQFVQALFQHPWFYSPATGDEKPQLTHFEPS